MRLGKEHIAQNRWSLSGHTQPFCQSCFKLKDLSLLIHLIYWKNWTCITLYVFGLSCVRRECNNDRCPSRKCNKHAFCMNGLVSVLRYTTSSPHWYSLFLQYLDCAAPHRVGSTGQTKKKRIKMRWHLVIAFCVPSCLTDMQRFPFECGFLY